jgi:hypothetical protein
MGISKVDGIKTVLIFIGGNMLSGDQLEGDIDRVEERLAALKKKAIKNKKSLLLNKRNGQIFVGEAIKKYPIDKEIVGRFLADADILKKYAGKKPGNLLDLVCILGGFNKSFMAMQISALPDKNWGNELEKDYMIHLSDVVYLCIIYSFKKITKRDLHSTICCCLCWRAVKSGSLQYCKLHQEDKMLRQRDERRLYAKIIERNDDHSIDLKRRLKSKAGRENIRFKKYHWSSLFAADVSVFDFYKYTKVSAPKPDKWRSDAKNGIDYLKNGFPLCHEVLKSVLPEAYDNWADWFDEIREKLDPECPPVITQDDINAEAGVIPVNYWLCYKWDVEDWALLLRIVHRFESYHALHSTPKKRGPKIGTVPKNDSLREKIKKIADKQIKMHGKIKAVAIADELSISAQRVSILLKELGLR